MKKLATTIFAAMVFALMVVSCGSKSRVIPPSKFASIYADIFIADQWILNDDRNRRGADTMWFYDPIFERYGFDREDYYKSVSFYLTDPQKYSKILKEAQTILRDHSADVTAFLEKDAEIKALANIPCLVPLFYRTPDQMTYTEAVKVTLAENGVYELSRNNRPFPFRGPKVIEYDIKEEDTASLQDEETGSEEESNESEEEVSSSPNEPARSPVRINQRTPVPILSDTSSQMQDTRK